MQCVGSVCCVQSLLSEGVEVDSSPLTFVLQAASTVHLQLQVTPRQSGRLSFSGSHLVSSVMLLSCHMRDRRHALNTNVHAIEMQHLSGYFHHFHLPTNAITSANHIASCKLFYAQICSSQSTIFTSVDECLWYLEQVDCAVRKDTYYLIVSIMSSTWLVALHVIQLGHTHLHSLDVKLTLLLARPILKSDEPY